LLVNVVIGLVMLSIAAWELSRNQRKALEEFSIALGVPIDQLEEPDHMSKVIEWSAKKFSNELFKNRISDICGSIRTTWRWLGYGVEVTTLLAVIWFTVTDDLSNAIYAWFVTVVVIFFTIVSTLFALLCHLLTARWPGQAKEARASLIELINKPTQDDSLFSWDEEPGW